MICPSGKRISLEEPGLESPLPLVSWPPAPTRGQVTLTIRYCHSPPSSLVLWKRPLSEIHCVCGSSPGSHRLLSPFYCRSLSVSSGSPSFHSSSSVAALALAKGLKLLVLIVCYMLGIEWKAPLFGSGKVCKTSGKGLRVAFLLHRSSLRKIRNPSLCKPKSSSLLFFAVFLV